MPLDDLASGFGGGLIRFVSYFLVDVIFEVLIKGAGWLICRPFSRDLDPDGMVVTVVGLLAWLPIFLAVYTMPGRGAPLPAV